jgi:hypothetical protein
MCSCALSVVYFPKHLAPQMSRHQQKTFKSQWRTQPTALPSHSCCQAVTGNRMGLSAVGDPTQPQPYFVLSAHPEQATFSTSHSYAKISYKGKSWRRENSIAVCVIEFLFSAFYFFSSSPLLAATGVTPPSNDWQSGLPMPCSQTLPRNLYYKAQSFTRSWTTHSRRKVDITPTLQKCFFLHHHSISFSEKDDIFLFLKLEILGDA